MIEAFLWPLSDPWSRHVECSKIIQNINLKTSQRHNLRSLFKCVTKKVEVVSATRRTVVSIKIAFYGKKKENNNPPFTKVVNTICDSTDFYWDVDYYTARFSTCLFLVYQAPVYWYSTHFPFLCTAYAPKDVSHIIPFRKRTRSAPQMPSAYHHLR